MSINFGGYRRPDDTVGVRNHVGVIPVSVSVSSVASKIADDAGSFAKATPHQISGNQPKAARQQTERVLTGIGKNPNFGAVLIVSLGTEAVDVQKIGGGIAQTGKAVEIISLIDEGGTKPTLVRGSKLVGELNEEIAGLTRQQVDIQELIVGVECGGSDATSGIAANPAVGNACDRLIESGGTACFSETPEFIGAEHILAKRSVSQSVANRILEKVDQRERMGGLMGVDLRGAQPTPGNQEGGLTTIEEKSLGAISKGGTKPIEDIVDYGEQLSKGGGLILMDTPGYDVESVVAKVAGGAQIIVFTTGRGSTTGNPVAPVIKVTGNPQTYEKMANNMDIDASGILKGESLSSVGEQIFNKIVQISNGMPTEAERRGLEEFAINEIQQNELR